MEAEADEQRCEQLQSWPTPASKTALCLSQFLGVPLSTPLAG